MRANPGRVAAARALMEVERGAHTEDALAELAPDDPSDRGLAWYLAFGVLRRRGHVDAALRGHLRQPLASLDAPLRAALRVGAFEKLFARTRDHAAVSQAVEVARATGGKRGSGLVNAVMRRVRPPRDLSRGEWLDHPDWLVARWDARYGEEATTRWCERNAEPPRLALVARRDPDALAAALRAHGATVSEVSIRGRVLPGVLRVDDAPGPVPELPGFGEGAFWVQDPAAVATVDLVGAGEGTRVLDACAAPGGKSFRMASAGARVTAVDRSRDRLERLRDGADRLDLSLETRPHDWEKGPVPDLGTFDAVLVDAPCTGLGTVRRHPEVRWRRQLVDVLSMTDRQTRILTAAATHVRPGGVLVYSVCSPEPEEGADVVRAFLAAHEGFRLESELSTAPPEDDEDAHYAARMVRGEVAS